LADNLDVDWGESERNALLSAHQHRNSIILFTFRQKCVIAAANAADLDTTIVMPPAMTGTRERAVVGVAAFAAAASEAADGDLLQVLNVAYESESRNPKTMINKSDFAI